LDGPFYFISLVIIVQDVTGNCSVRLISSV
jgi:hypothetical protein